MGTTRPASEAGPTLDAPVGEVGRDLAEAWSERALWLVVVAFGAAVGVGIAGTLWALVGLAHPDPGFGYVVFDDALQIHAGQWPWQDPATGYVGLIYPPGFSGLIAGLLHIHMWSGWGVLVSIASSLVLAAITAKLAYRRDGTPPATAARVLEAAAVGLVAWWLVTCTTLPGTDGRADTTAWALALGGMLLVGRALAGSGRALCAAVVLLTLGLWSKQHAGGAAIAAVAWAAMACLAGVAPWRRAAVLTAALGAVNLAILGALHLASDGWMSTYVFEMPRNHYWDVAPLGVLLKSVWQILWLPLAFASVTLAAAAWAVGRERLRWRRLSGLLGDRDAGQLVLLLLFMAVVTPVAISSERKQGSGDNQLIAPLWGLGMLAAVGWRVAGRRRGPRVLTGLAVATLGLLGLGFGHPLRAEETVWAGGMNRIRDIVTITRLPEVPKASLDAARGHTLFDWYHSDLGMSDGLVPSSAIVCDVTAAGLSPVALERAMAARRYDLVQLAPFAGQTACSGFGKWEENYFWKLNALIKAGYRQNPARYPAEILERRPGAAPAAAARRLLRCFAPYRLGGVLFRIGAGGGFWCQSKPTDPRLTLGEIPARFSKVLSDGVVTGAAGSLVVTLPAGTGEVMVGADRDGNVEPLAQLTADTARTVRAVVTFGARQGAAAQAAVIDGGAEQAVDVAELEGDRLALLATAKSRARFDFSGLTLRTEGGVVRGAATRRGLP
jgi:hypothetical protein